MTDIKITPELIEKWKKNRVPNSFFVGDEYAEIVSLHKHDVPMEWWDEYGWRKDRDPTPRNSSLVRRVAPDYVLPVEPTYAERQAKCGLRPGDRVRMTRSFNEGEQGFQLTWQPPMDDSIGSHGIVGRLSSCSVQVDFDDGAWWYLPYFVLEKVVEPKWELIEIDWENKDFHAAVTIGGTRCCVSLAAERLIAQGRFGGYVFEYMGKQIVHETSWAPAQNDALTWMPIENAGPGLRARWIRVLEAKPCQK